MAKYKRRWVELTTATLVYCPTQLDVLTGQLQVFAVADMIWVRAEADTKFQVGVCRTGGTAAWSVTRLQSGQQPHLGAV